MWRKRCQWCQRLLAWIVILLHLGPRSSICAVKKRNSMSKHNFRLNASVYLHDDVVVVVVFIIVIVVAVVVVSSDLV